MAAEAPPVEGSQGQEIGPYDITFSLKPGASAEDAVYLHEQVKAHPYVIDSEMSVADFAGECDRLRAENERYRKALESIRKPTKFRGCLDPQTWIDLAQNTASLALGGSQAKGSE